MGFPLQQSWRVCNLAWGGEDSIGLLGTLGCCSTLSQCLGQVEAEAGAKAQGLSDCWGQGPNRGPRSVPTAIPAHPSGD